MIQAIVTDIEGTTSSLSFVKDVLFPYARQHLADFIRQHQHTTDVASLLADARSLVGNDGSLDSLIDQFLHWMDEDRKITPLKSLQGLIWLEGYQQGAFKGHIYPDAVHQLQAWNAQGIALYVYSSGSVQAQKLLFGHSDVGDLTPLFAGYFDTCIGGKREAASYRRIAGHIGLPAEHILFLSDIREELDAARAAGMATRWLVREQARTDDAVHTQVVDFDAIAF
ncbi:MAG: acireductone synthase [Methylomonas sp.]|nr:acireductone synthase [Methylomonas sp.]PPD20313.1 MAG: acireductone synthase [Methylomonas sp.]PPD25369.1 MAG: acireductone synthase [Methylomonas sp.]PPD35386.1 MAG: acireductone synthase [Methylomonas sp.]PPD37841.1 MAG: acireductone synthase [Methylomonas sp.]